MKFKLGRKVLEFDSRVAAEREAKRLGVKCQIVMDSLPELVERLTADLDRYEREIEQQRDMIKALEDYVADLESAVRTASSLGQVLRKRK